MTQQQCVRYLVAGRVQGVGFRISACREADRLGLRGFTQNLANGQVEVVACGAPEAVAELRAWLEKGPSGARVSDVAESMADDPGIDGFQVR